MGPKKNKQGKTAGSDCDDRPAPQLTLGNFLFPNDQITAGSSTQPEQASVVSAVSKPVQICSVKRTKKGNAPVTVENSFGGRKVTIISNVSGDASSLLKQMKTKFGTGGEFTEEGKIELQGDHGPKVSKFLKENNYLVN